MSRPGPAPTEPCGTAAAYQRHWRENRARKRAGLPELPYDQPCVSAHRAYQNELYARRHSTARLKAEARQRAAAILIREYRGRFEVLYHDAMLDLAAEAEHRLVRR